MGPACRAATDLVGDLAKPAGVECGRARAHGRRRRVFCASLADVFDNQAPNEWRTDLFNLIRETPVLDWQLLTKRPQNIARMLPRDWGAGYPNVWLGITTEDEERFRQRWPILSRIPAARRFISYEPAIAPLGPIAIGDWLPDWIICGGERPQGAIDESRLGAPRPRSMQGARRRLPA
jgi:protein gp37